jgi:hypothetical protein
MRAKIGIVIVIVIVAAGMGCSSAHEMQTDSGTLPADSGGAADTGPSPVDAGPGPVICGSVTCATGYVCCNASCGICALPTEGCIALDCSDAGPVGRACGGIAGATCASDEWCDYPDGSYCGGDDEQGVCRPRPDSCPEPGGILVCGCDGTDYIGECSASLAGIDVAHTGSCDETPPPAGAWAATPTCAPWDGAAWRFVATGAAPTCTGAPTTSSLTIELWEYLEAAAPGTTYTIGTGTSGGSQGQATSCPAGPTGPPCMTLTGTVTVHSFTASGSAELSYSLTASGGPTYIGDHVTVGAWCASERFCG